MRALSLARSVCVVRACANLTLSHAARARVARLQELARFNNSACRGVVVVSAEAPCSLSCVRLSRTALFNGTTSTAAAAAAAAAAAVAAALSLRRHDASCCVGAARVAQVVPPQALSGAAARRAPSRAHARPLRKSRRSFVAASTTRIAARRMSNTQCEDHSKSHALAHAHAFALRCAARHTDLRYSAPTLRHAAKRANSVRRRRRHHHRRIRIRR